MNAPVLLQVEHETRYHYGAPVELAHHVAFLRPLEDARQQVESCEIGIEPAPSHQAGGADVFGNHRLFFSATSAHQSLCVRAASRVRVSPMPVFDPAATPPWEALADRLRYHAGAAFEPAAEFCAPSPYVPRLAALRDYALPSFAPGTPVAAGALDLMHRVHREFRYETASTAIDTPLQQVLAERHGVCQDFAHLMIGGLRALGLAARYVSGYLLTTPPEGMAPLQGADASHAWVSVYCPGVPGQWLDLDPTNDLVVSTEHVRLAHGRDYGDVTPLRGVIRGGGRHTLEVRVRTEKI
jgi:transglutaminase-like putative cysteine protease